MAETGKDEGSAFVMFPPDVNAHPIRDLSRRGMSLRAYCPVELLPKVGVPVDARVHVGGQELTVRVLVANVDGQSVGCAVIGDNPEWKKLMDDIGNPIRIGRALQEVKDDDGTEGSPDGLYSRRYQSGPSFDLYVWLHEDHSVASIQIFFMWTVVEWDAEHGLRTGQMENPSTGERQYNTTNLFSLRSPPDLAILEPVRRILIAANIPDEYRRPFVRD
ncbi:MAG: hypothetical protein A2289_26200 [Deltaproteobacteria bacterium RIFOXYA12_FULL_58_15]|nr:MAG: hypothetical protein A2289_26200 [Deltaproteobacteria bacterium RIFOXYA12_FULL_58_15]OGR12203.1 MAG: hypothetical protein A2341_11635 [Deltaproteobacteria bacterium RIFOXYB12_FULL_58_9]